MSRPVFAPGFRLSYLDVAVLVSGSVVGAGLAIVSAYASLIVLFVVGHFFLFCNVFRLSRSLELAWGAIFTVLTATTLVSGFPGWLATTGASLAMTGLAVGLEMRKPSYHGVFWQRVNPDLPEWWAINHQTPE